MSFPRENRHSARRLILRAPASGTALILSLFFFALPASSFGQLLKSGAAGATSSQATQKPIQLGRESSSQFNDWRPEGRGTP